MADSRKLTYSRASAGLTPVTRVETVSGVPEINTSNVGYVNSQIPVGYEKTSGTLSYSIICVISGGTERERKFLNELEKKRSFKTLDVIFLSSERAAGGLTPKMMKAKYDNICKNGVLNVHGRNVCLEDVDVVYMLTDVDHYETDLREILSKQVVSQPIWIISNPDFEIWIYYCFRNNPEIDLKEKLTNENCKRQI